jgi:lipoate-protein ligase A
MINKIKLYEGNSFDPYLNLATEQYLMETVEEDACILFLWQNQNTVVIGKNQNAWKECRTTLLNEEGGVLARRLSGGGAVFHDLGNLNFTFLVPQEEYDLDRQFAVIAEAVSMLGLNAERSGRNDVLAEGRKFSGNAFYKNGKQAYHHGTLLIDVDMGKLGRYLNPSKAKLQAKGVDSVRSRVVNLTELNPNITIASMKDAMAKAFAKVYDKPMTVMTDKDFDHEAIEQLRQRNASWEWNYGQKLPFSVEFEGRLPWGGLQICLQVESGVVSTAKVYSDAMDWTLAPELERLLNGCRYTKECLIECVMSLQSEEKEDICNLIREQDI